MNQFLNSIAEGYLLAEELTLDRHTFIFPNARSAAYFRNYLGQKTPLEEKRIKTMCITMAEFVEKSSGRRRASDERLLFMLYRAYCNIKNDEPRAFDNFRYWGEMILRDFSEVDKYMADPKELFRNIKSRKEIQTFYLTDIQRKIIRDFWGEDPYWNREWQRKQDEELPFWGHLKKKSDTIDKYSQLWEILGPLYAEFHRLLDLNGECYTGLAYRRVATALLNNELPAYKSQRYVFIGFNRLSTAEHVIFDRLNSLGLAHFYWDYDPLLMNPKSGNKAGRFISKYVAAFSAALPEVSLPAKKGSRRVDVIGVPSNVAQTKVAASCLSEEDTAIVLASDDILLPMVNSIPDEFEINVTMGYPLRHSALAQLFSLIMNLQLRARQNSEGDTLFFRDDVLTLLRAPLIQAHYTDECRNVEQFLKDNHLFNLPASLVASEEVFEQLRPLFVALSPEAAPSQVADFVSNVLNYAAEGGLLNKLDMQCAKVVSSMVTQIAELAAEFDVEMLPMTFLRMIDRSIFKRSLAMDGRSFNALQIMGVLETRALSFKHVVMLSMTDASFPGRNHGRSFIPDSLRQAYGLPTGDHLEADSAHYFFRLLSNAEHLTLIYDARVGGLRSGEMSRYIFQLRDLNFPGVKLSLSMASFASSAPGEVSSLISPDIEVCKTPEIMQRLNRYRNPELLYSFSLSASSLKKYLACPLSFYLERVQDIRPPEEDSDEVNAATWGSTVHEVAERVYQALAETNPDGEITEQMLSDLLHGGYNGLLLKETYRSLRANIDKVPRTVTDTDGNRIDNPLLETAPLSDQAEFHLHVVNENIRRLFKRETLPFKFKAAELSKTFVWKNVAPDIDINFTMKIDRLDSIVEHDNVVTRIIDYKTGNDTTHLSDLDAMFSEDNSKSHPHAIFQLFTYCAAYADKFSPVDTTLLRPQIFKFREKDNGSGHFSLLSLYGSKKNSQSVDITCFNLIEKEFRARLADMFSELFNPEVPFVRARDESACNFCGFKNMCHR